MQLEKDIKIKLGWIRLFEELGNAGIVCRRCGISRPTLRKWLKRYQEKGIEGLKELSRKPFNSPARKIFETEESLILSIRSGRKLGVRRIQSELKRQHHLSFTTR